MIMTWSYIYAHACTVHAYAHYSGCSTLFCSVHARTRSEGGLDSRVWVWPHSVQVCLSIWLSWRQVRGLCIQALWLLCSALSDLSHTHTWDGCRTVASLSLILMSCVWQCSSSDEKRSFHRGGKQMNWAQLRLCLNQHLNRELSNHWLNRSNEGDTPSATHGEVPVILCVCVVQLQLGSMTG